jgi:hypothetical protein
MQQDVQKYLDYLEARKQKHRFTIVLEAIQWSEEYAEDDDNVVSFWVDGQRVAEVKDVDSVSGGETGEIGKYEMTKDLTLEESAELKVQIKNIEYFIFDGLWRDKDGGEGTSTVKLSQLDSYLQKLNPGHWGVCTARYRLTKPILILDSWGIRTCARPTSIGWPRSPLDTPTGMFPAVFADRRS